MGVESGRDYSGWLAVADRGEGGSEVVVHLSFGERSAEPEIEEQTSEDENPLAEGISVTLESIRRQIEEGSGKLAAPPEGLEPPSEENPAIVYEDPHENNTATNTGELSARRLLNTLLENHSRCWRLAYGARFP